MKNYLSRAIMCGIMFIALLSIREVLSEVTWNDGLYGQFTYRDFVKFGPPRRPIGGVIDYPLLNAALFFELNHARQDSERKAFIHSAALQKASMMHSEEMTRRDFFSHHNPNDASKRTLPKRLALFGIGNTPMSENIARAFAIQYQSGTPVIPPGRAGGFRDARTERKIPPHTYLTLARSVVTDWMGSAGHRANILNPEYRYAGCGASHFRDESFYEIDSFKITCVFASRVPE